jgi:SP family arabinose:H+ symporter-like MFS transporter
VYELNKRLLAAALTGSLGGFVFGYDLGALSSATQSLRSQFDLSPAALGPTISFSIWGTVLGSLLAGRFADQVKREHLIAGCSLLYAIAGIGATLPTRPEWPIFLTMRFLCGMAIGGFTVGCPLYLSELAPIALRGRVVSLFQIQVGLGVVVAFSAGLKFTHFKPTGDTWRLCLGAGAIPAAVLCLLMLFQSRRESNVPIRLIPSSLSIARRTVKDKSPHHEPLFRRSNARPILLATSIAIFNQLSGVNILLLYMLDILTSAGIGFALGHRYTVLISCLGLAMTLLGMVYVDRWGRKPLLLIGCAGMAVCLLCLGLAIPHRFAPFLYLLILIVYNVFFAFSQGTVVWVYLSELFPPGIRGAGQGYAASVHWITNAVLVSIFPVIQHASSAEIFYFFALMMVLQIGVIWRWYPETRGTMLGSFARKIAHNGTKTS